MPRRLLLVSFALVLAPCVASPQGQPLGPEFLVNTYTIGLQAEPSVAYDHAGNFIVVRRSAGQDGSQDGIYGQRYASSGDPLGPEFRANTFTTNLQGGLGSSV